MNSQSSADRRIRPDARAGDGRSRRHALRPIASRLPSTLHASHGDRADVVPDVGAQTDRGTRDDGETHRLAERVAMYAAVIGADGHRLAIIERGACRMEPRFESQVPHYRASTHASRLCTTGPRSRHYITAKRRRWCRPICKIFASRSLRCARVRSVHVHRRRARVPRRSGSGITAAGASRGEHRTLGGLRAE